MGSVKNKNGPPAGNPEDDGDNGGGVTVFDLFASAEQEGVLSAASMQALNVVDLGAQIQAGLGITVDDVAQSEVVLVTIMPDDSGSIRSAGNATVVQEGHNQVLDALGKSSQKSGVLLHTRYLNGDVLFPYGPIERAVRMDPANYNPNQGTPLYDQTIVVLGTVLAKAQQFADNGVAVRTVTLLITDGGDAHSTRARASDVKAVVRDMQKAEIHTVAAMGIDDGTTDFRKVFTAMGIEDRWILTPKSNAADIRRAFTLFSQSAVQASQAVGRAGQAAALRGFGR